MCCLQVMQINSCVCVPEDQRRSPEMVKDLGGERITTDQVFTGPN